MLSKFYHWPVIAFIAALFIHSASAEATTHERFFVSAATNAIASAESILQIHYQLHCDSLVNPLLVQPMTGTVYLPHRILRLDFTPGNTLIEASLGTALHENGVWVQIDSNPHCKIDTQAQIQTLQSPDSSTDLAKKYEQLALEHSPFLVLRRDQYNNPYTDIPMLMAYHVTKHHRAGVDTVSLTYTAYFTDEDSKTDSVSTDGQMGRYGRRTDIEWIYRVDFNSKMQVIGRRYQGFLHFEHEFAGEFIKNSNHPILYNYALKALGKTGKNNIFADIPTDNQLIHILEGHHLVPRYRVDYPLPREWAMMVYPWMHQTSDHELARENKLSTPATDFLFILLDGTVKGCHWAKVTLSDGTEFYSGNKSSNFDRMDEDMWNQKGITSLPLGAQRLQSLTEGKISLKLNFETAGNFCGVNATLKLNKKPLFFRLINHNGSYRSEEIRLAL